MTTLSLSAVDRRRRTLEYEEAETDSSPYKSDSESEFAPLTVQKKKSVFRQRASSKKSKNLFGLLSDEDEDLAIENSHRKSESRQKLDSSLTSKVANGVVRRTSELDGIYYVEVRVYNTSDAVKTPPVERYKKALVTLKTQLNNDTAEWQSLQKFMHLAKTLFGDKEPVFYSNKINFK